MTRLQSQLRRLYAPQASCEQDDAQTDAPISLIDTKGLVRAMVLELRQPANWAALSSVWQGVQADLGLPAPAIAVNGVDGYQLWFSLQDPVPAPQASRFLHALQARYVPDISAQRLRLLPRPDAESPEQAMHVDRMPAEPTKADQWSAFVAQDLAPMFAETPWLDMPPSPEGQADLLSRMTSIQAVDFQAAMAVFQPVDDAPSPPSTKPTGAHDDPKEFLLGVMNDERVSLSIRMEAAKALMPYMHKGLS